MELWIRSQDKKRLLKVFDVYISGTYNSTIKANFGAHYSGCQYVELGEYKSTARALEVLDEIQSILKPAIKALTPLTESKEDYKNHCMKTELVGYETTYDIVALPTYVYEMPKE